MTDQIVLSETHNNAAGSGGALAVVRLVVIPQAGRACSLHQPKLSNQALREFAMEIGWV